ncbi:hypothetical protein C7C46_21645 [Streptomyces tateyamensis]|uniref:SnoaL-like domain-containing protein n=1 Tax=Streptomyces tateyamensis TaxID=565073 RepID=A0A2V4NMA8_9ACTN|nr:nuclear transport factor 2 family protein [Streptomyces tateyamensis]PYC76788.1 hypothetical protein C7C46_21645 [Streptomyces tateyamensis]
MSDNATARELFEELIDRITSGRWSQTPELYAEDAVVEVPFSPFEPKRMVGRAALQARFDELGGNPPYELTVRNLVIHQSADPEVVIAEFDYVGRHLPSGRTFEAPNIQLVRARGGRIVHTRDYHHHAVIAAASGGLEQFTAAFQQ